MFFGTIFLIIMYLIFKYILAWIKYVNSLDTRLGESTWRWTYDYQVLGDRDYSDLDDKDFVRLRRKKNKLVTTASKSEKRKARTSSFKALSTNA